MELRSREGQIDALKLVLQGTQRRRCSSQNAREDGKGADETTSGSFMRLSLTCVYESGAVSSCWGEFKLKRQFKSHRTF